MKTRHPKLFIALTVLSILISQLPPLHAQGTAFTYQGRLNDGPSPANGTYDLRFTIYDSTNAPGTIIAGPLTNSSLAVTNGLFTVPLDFGADVFDGDPRWLEIAVRTHGNGAFTVLNRRQAITPTPYAITAGTATKLLGGFTVQSGDTNGAPNVIGGSSVNYVSTDVIGATIAGGGVTNLSGTAYSNQVTAYFGTVGGGEDNTSANFRATVGGGAHNTASGGQSVVSGGIANTADGIDAAIGGGGNNRASGLYATVGGGEANMATGSFATVSGGGLNHADGEGSFAAGYDAQAVHDGAFVWADDTSGPFSSTALNQFSVRATGGVRLITGGGGVKLGSTGQYFAPGGQENLRIIRGVVDLNGNLLHGTGFTVTRTGTGAYTITFSGAFADFPAITVSAQAGVPRMATTTNVGANSAQIRIFDVTGAAVDAQFHFIAFGQQ